MRIEMVLPTLDAAGMEVMVANLTRGLVGRGHQVGVTCLEEDGLIADELRAVGVRVAVIRNPGFRGVLRPTRLEAWLRQVRPDLVHAHSGGWLKAARAAHRAGVPHVVHTVHGLLDHEPWHGVLFKRWATRYTARVIAVSEPLRQYLLRVVRLPPAKTTLVLGPDQRHRGLVPRIRPLRPVVTCRGHVPQRARGDGERSLRCGDRRRRDAGAAWQWCGRLPGSAG